MIDFTTDAERWNKRYRIEGKTAEDAPRDYLIRHLSLMPESGRVLDIAMGKGANAAYMCRMGYEVIGIDISSEAVRLARKRDKRIAAFVADNTAIMLPTHYFSIIMNFYYLQRGLFSQFREWLSPHGCIIIETLTQSMLEIKKDINPEYLLKPGELLKYFSSWNVIDYYEGWLEGPNGKRRAVAQLFARLTD